MMRWWWIPLLLVALFVGLAAYQLTQPRDDVVQSAMIGRELPQFSLDPALGEGPALTEQAFRDGMPKLLNIWASWCVPCIAEAPQLETLKDRGVPIVGVAIRDRPEDIAAFLQRHGNPYARLARDDLSELQLEIGSSGVPETFVIDGDGVIRYQHIGDIRAEHVPILMRQLREAAE